VLCCGVAFSIRIFFEVQVLLLYHLHFLASDPAQIGLLWFVLWLHRHTPLIFSLGGFAADELVYYAIRLLVGVPVGLLFGVVFRNAMFARASRVAFVWSCRLDLDKVGGDLADSHLRRVLRYELRAALTEMNFLLGLSHFREYLQPTLHFLGKVGSYAVARFGELAIS